MTVWVVQLRTEEETRAGKRLTSKELFQEFSKNLTITHGEAVTDSYTKLALQLHDNLLCSSAVRQCLLDAEEFYGKKSPLDSLYKLQALHQNCKTLAHAEWCLNYCFDAVLNRALRPSEVSITTLTGHKTALGKGPFDRKVCLIISTFNLESCGFNFYFVCRCLRWALHPECQRLLRIWIFKMDAKRRLFAHIDEAGLCSAEDLEVLKKAT